MANEKFNPDIGKATQFNGETAAENGRKGALKTNEIRRKKKTLREIMINFSEGKIANSKLKSQMKNLGIDDEEITNKTAVGIGLWQEAVKGNVSAYKEYMALIGEQIPSEINVNSNIKVNPFADMSTEDILKHIELLEGGNGNNNNKGTDN